MTMGDHIKATRPADVPDRAATPVDVEDTAVPAAPVDVVETADAA